MHNTQVMINTPIRDVGGGVKAEPAFEFTTREPSSEVLEFQNNFKDDEKHKMATPPSDKSVEDALSKGLLNLSITDRNALEEEIHGVRCTGLTEETPKFLKTSLHEFNRELMFIKNSPTRMATIQNAKNIFYKKQPSKAKIPEYDVLKNVIDTTAERISELPKSSSTSGAQSKQQCYLNDPDVRLRFLRCENFDAKAAVKRFINFLELAREVFGDYVIDRPIRVSDFFEAPNGGRQKRYQQHEKKALSNSRVQYLPFRDRSGRRVKVAVGDCNAHLDIALRIKIHLVQDWIVSEDVETQQRGVVGIVWLSDGPSMSVDSLSTIGNANSSGNSSASESEDETSKWESILRPKYSRSDMVYHRRYHEAVPIRTTAMHWCSQDRPIYRILNALFYFSIDSRTQSRFRNHFGEPLEIRYSLQAFGIPVDLLPLTHSMDYKRKNHVQWLASRRLIEEKQDERQQKQQQQGQHLQQQQQQFQTNLLQQQWDDEKAMKYFGSSSPQSSNIEPIVVECPRSYDVIIGKAKVCANNPGNGFYSSLIEATHDEHDSLIHARDKVAMTWKILLHITEERKGRFLDWDKTLNSWVVMQDRIVIRKKIANSYKEYKRSRHNKKKHSPDNTPSSGNASNDSALYKRRKTNGCLGGSDSDKEIGAMFANM